MKLCAAGALLWVKPVLYNARACAEDTYALFMVEIYPMVNIMRSSHKLRATMSQYDSKWPAYIEYTYQSNAIITIYLLLINNNRDE